jgi:hypothetical protein
MKRPIIAMNLITFLLALPACRLNCSANGERPGMAERLSTSLKLTRRTTRSR